MGTVGVWTMNEDGEFTLQEPYATYLAEAKLCATQGWRESLYAYLVERSPYTRDELNDEMLRRVAERECSAMELLEEFVIEAVSGDLMPR